MKRIVVMYALFGVLALSGIATASAWAVAEIKVKGGGETTGTAAGGISVFRSSTIEVECESSESNEAAVVKNGSRSVSMRLLFRGCREGSASCATKGQAKGSILTVLLLLTIYGVSEGGVDGYAENEATKGTHTGELASFECGIIKAKVTGCLAGEVTKVGGFSKTHKVKSILGATEAEGPNGTKFKCELIINGVGKAEEEITTTLTTMEEVEVV